MNKPRFFTTPAVFGRWLASNHAKRSELLVGLYKKHAAHRGMTYLEAVDEALCWGWIDGVMRRLDEDAVVQRFTPRKSKSTWSLINCRKVEVLIAAGRMRAPGLAAWQARDPARTGIYSFEQARAAFTPVQTKAFKRFAKAWKWFHVQAESYQAAATFWVVSAKQEATRVRRLAELIEHSAAGKKLRRFTPMDQRSK
jgi:uncharacterized protein YdeI (YjbR/CyaY-like superfamily)